MIQKGCSISPVLCARVGESGYSWPEEEKISIPFQKILHLSAPLLQRDLLQSCNARVHDEKRNRENRAAAHAYTTKEGMEKRGPAGCAVRFARCCCAGRAQPATTKNAKNATLGLVRLDRSPVLRVHISEALNQYALAFVQLPTRLLAKIDTQSTVYYSSNLDVLFLILSSRK